MTTLSSLGVWFDKVYWAGDRGWFVLSDAEIIGYLNPKTKECKLVYIRSNPMERKFRKYSQCIGCDDKIYILPDRQNEMLIYNPSTNDSKVIEIDNVHNKRAVSCADIYDGNMYVLISGNNYVYKFSLSKEVFEDMYSLGDYGDGDYISVVYQHCFFAAIEGTVKLKVFNLIDKSLQIYDLSDYIDEISTIAVVDNKIWVSGKQRKIIIFDKIEQSVQSIKIDVEIKEYNYFLEDKLSLYSNAKNFYNRIFSESCITKDYVWFIPNCADKIIYINRYDFGVRVFEVENEIENYESFNERERLKQKYMLVYTKDNRYIGLYSFKNKYLLEIDQDDMKYTILDYDVVFAESENNNVTWESGIYEERRRSSLVYYISAMRNTKSTMDCNICSCGPKIMQELLK